jgi:hypothetical protein
MRRTHRQRLARYRIVQEQRCLDAATDGLERLRWHSPLRFDLARLWLALVRSSPRACERVRS